ncbi:hypothetical protein [Methylobacterium sp. NEAU K]|uniref:hypothetical protein n=1 Tax=Methylobacterium sp. NEAU K TaxID=3064946 RepID=UPI00273340E8|nr:hypothetical protein [Methylobacterium sp. NEAU K]MDP4002135.1 hypothetical protein [Methylobacterium sp. NEAU K]
MTAPPCAATASGLMERLLIIVAVLACVVAGVAVIAMSARSRREPLRMGAELDAEDEHLLIGALGPLRSPIDRTAQVLDPRMLDLGPTDPVPTDLEPIAAPEKADRIEPPRRSLPGAAR